MLNICSGVVGSSANEHIYDVARLQERFAFAAKGIGTMDPSKCEAAMYFVCS